jgi:beta-glucuronidase
MLWSEIPAYQIRVHDLVTMTPPAVAWARQNILVNGNHPSVILWSIANELSARVGPTQSFYIRAVAAAVHALDPTRPVGLAVAGVPSVGCQAGYAPLDFIGLNDYFGWYVGPNGQIADPSLLPNFLDQARACYPHKALIVSEFGAEANRDGPVEIRGTNQYQEAFLTYHLGVYASKPYLAGAIYWALEDFRVRPGWTGANPDPDPPIFQKGLLDFNGNPKPAYALVKAAYHAVQQVG